MTAPRVCVIIPAYKASRTIGRALMSLSAQERRPDEVIVIDDGSPDGAALADAIQHYDGPLRLFRQENGGAARARNAGIEASQCELLAFLDADDYWEPNKLRRQLEILSLHPTVGIVAGQYFLQEPGEARVAPCQSPGLPPLLDRVITSHGAEAFDLATRIWTSTVLVRRKVLADHRFIPGLEPAEDRDLWFRLVKTASAYFLSDRLATYVQEPGSLSRSNVDVDCANMLRVVRRHADDLGYHQARMWEADTFRRWASVHLYQGRPRYALRPAAARLFRQPFSAQGWYILAKAAALAAMPGRLVGSFL